MKALPNDTQIKALVARFKAIERLYPPNPPSSQASLSRAGAEYSTHSLHYCMPFYFI